MLVKLSHRKVTEKICDKFIFSLRKCYFNSRGMGKCVGWTNQLVRSYCPLFFLYFPPANLGKLEKLFEVIWLDTVTSNLFSYPPLYSTTIHKINPTLYLVSSIKSREIQWLNQCSINLFSDEKFQKVIQTKVQRGRSKHASYCLIWKKEE